MGNHMLVTLGAFASLVVPLIVMGFKFGRLSKAVDDLEKTVEKIDSLSGLTQRADGVQSQCNSLFGIAKEHRNLIDKANNEIARLQGRLNGVGH